MIGVEEMSEQIDWSKAPEGYPLWITDLDGIIMPGWHKEIEGKYVDMHGAFWNKSGGGFTVHERPATQSWSGEGLPPVGLVCEYHSGYVEQPFEYAQCEIIAHFEGEQSKKLAAFKYTAHDGVVQLGRGAPGLFRPIRTPEQIAADEREAAIKEMTAGYAKNSDTLAGWAAYVYDTLGYRKP